MNRKEKKAAAAKRRLELTDDLLTFMENTIEQENRPKCKCTVAFDLIPKWVFNRSAKDPQCRATYLAVGEKVRIIMKDKGHSKMKNIIRWMRKNWRLPETEAA